MMEAPSGAFVMSGLSIPWMSDANTETTRAELAALADTLDRCRERIADLAQRRTMSIRDPNAAEVGDDMLMAMYEAERGVNTALRLVQRAVRQGRAG